MNSSNAVIVGRVTKPLEVKEVNVGGKTKTVGNLTVCAVKTVKNTDGSREVPTFYEVSVWDRAQQETLGALGKGETVLLQGQLEAKRYEKNKDNGIALSLTDVTVTPLGNKDAAVQRIVAVGRVTQDVVLEQTSNGHKVARIPLALNHGGDKTSFVEVEVWDNYAEQIVKSVKKGSLLTVNGELDVNTYGNRNGGQTSKLRIINAQIGFMDKSAKAIGAGASGQFVGNAGKNGSNTGR